MGFNPFGSGKGGSGGGFTPSAAQRAAMDSGITAELVADIPTTPEQQAAINSGITTEGVEAIVIKDGNIPPEPQPREEIKVDITSEVNNAGWVWNDQNPGYGYVATNYNGTNAWKYVSYKFVVSSVAIELNPEGDDGYDYIETSFPSFMGSNNEPEFYLVFLSELPEGYNDSPDANPGWPTDDSFRMNQYVVGYVKNTFNAGAAPKTGKVMDLRIKIPNDAKYVKAVWYTQNALANDGLTTWVGTKPSINDFYMRKVKSGTYRNLTSQFNFKSGKGMMYTSSELAGHYYVKTDSAVFAESNTVRIQDVDDEYEKLVITVPRYTAGAGGGTNYCLVFLTETTVDYNEADWENGAGGPYPNEYFVMEHYTHTIRTAPSSLGNGYGSTEQLEIDIPSNARYIKAIWFKDDFTNWEGHGEVEFSCMVYKADSGESFEKQIFTTQVYGDPMNNEATTLDDGHSSDKKNYRFVVVLPKNYSHTGKPSKVLMLCHGGTGEVRSDGYWYPGDQEDIQLTIDMFRENGYVIFDVDKDTVATNQCYGSPIMLEAYYNAFNYLKEHYNVEDKLSIYAMSMGTNTAFNFVNLYRPLVKAVLITGPRTGVANDNFNNMGAETLANFGATAANIETKFYPFNILGQIMTLSDGQDTVKSLTRNIPPTKIIALNSDRAGDQWTEGYDDVAEALHNAGNFIVVRTVTSNLTHAQFCHLYDEDLRQEAIDWFNKYGK